MTIAGSPSGTAATASETADHEHLHERPAAQQPGQGDNRHDAAADVQQGLTHSRQPLLQRRHALLRGREQVGDSAELGLHPGRDDLGASPVPVAMEVPMKTKS